MQDSLRGLTSIFHTRVTSVHTRYLWVAGACLSLNTASDLSNSFANAPHFGGPLVAWFTFIAFLGLFGLGVAAVWRWRAMPLSPALPRTILIYALLLWALWTGTQAIGVIARIPTTLASTANYGSDELYFAQYNAWLFLHGENPYHGDHLSAILATFPDAGVTPIRRPPFSDPLRPPTPAQISAIIATYRAMSAAPHPQLEPATTHSYPALSFLLAVPSVALGLPTLGYMQVLGLVALLAMLVALAPTRWRIVIVLLCLMNVDGIRSVASSDFEIWPILALALVWLLRERRWGAVVALGAACSIQQTAWFAAPFYIVWVSHRRGWQAALREGAAAIGIFALINLPWIIRTPAEWLHSLLLPMTLPLFPTGGGLVGLALGGALPLFPPLLYTLLEFGTLVGLLYVYQRWLPRMPYVGIILPTLPLLFAWRSPSRYFILLPFLIVLAMLLTQREEDESSDVAWALSDGNDLT